MVTGVAQMDRANAVSRALAACTRVAPGGQWFESTLPYNSVHLRNNSYFVVEVCLLVYSSFGSCFYYSKLNSDIWIHFHSVKYK
jgi:hypothetical protein